MPYKSPVFALPVELKEEIDNRHIIMEMDAEVRELSQQTRRTQFASDFLLHYADCNVWNSSDRANECNCWAFESDSIDRQVYLIQFHQIPYNKSLLLSTSINQ